MKISLVVAVLSLSIPLAYADQASFTNSGGYADVGNGSYVSSNVANPAGSLTMNCPSVSTGACAGGSLVFSSADGTVNINASFTSGTYAEGCSGGGKGGKITCTYTFTGNFRGTLTASGASQAIIGITYQAFGAGGSSTVSGTTAYNSAYTPFYYSDTGQILRSDDLQGTNQISYGTQGSGVGQFYGAYGIALDASGRIYIADTYNCRIVRIDNMQGNNWTEYGSCGSATGQFYDPQGIALDGAGRLYILDSGNGRVVRIDDLNGTNWVSYGTLGSGAGQFAQWLSSIAVDTSGRIYIADTGNKRLVRFDDMSGANWTALTQSAPINGVSYSLQSPVAVALDPAGKIYVADAESYQPAVIRMDDMTGANWTSIFLGSGSGVNCIVVDSAGTVFTGGGGVKLVDGMSAVLTSPNSISPYGSYYVFGITAIPVPNPRPSAIGFSPATLSFSQNVGSASAPQPVTISNFGGRPLDIFNISANGGFAETNNCPSVLTAGATCAVNVSFTPSAPGPVSGQLSIADDAGNLGGSQNISITGTGTTPAASVTPASLSFSSVVVGSSSTARTVITLQSTGTGPLQITNIIASAPFTQTNNCTAPLASGTSCAIQVTFTPTSIGSFSGTLAISDNAGTQTITLTGSGSSQAAFSSTSLEFSSTLIGTTSTPKSVTLTNRGTTTLGITNIVVSSSYAIASNTCGVSLAPGTNCSVSVTFSPATTGTINGTLVFTDSAINSPQTITLTGSGTAPVTLSPTSLSFGTVAVGNTSAAKSVTLTNHLTTSLSFSSIQASAGFNVATNTCGTSVAAGATCTVGVTFSPTSTTAVSGSLIFTDSAANSPQSVSLSGTGTAPVTLSAGTLSFGTVTVGTTSSAKSVTLTNRQNVALHFSSIAATAGFAIASNTCGTSIAAGATCSVGVTFTPGVSGSITGTLTFADDAANSPQTVSLTGTGR